MGLDYFLNRGYEKIMTGTVRIKMISPIKRAQLAKPRIKYEIKK